MRLFEPHSYKGEHSETNTRTLSSFTRLTSFKESASLDINKPEKERVSFMVPYLLLAGYKIKNDLTNKNNKTTFAWK